MNKFLLMFISLGLFLATAACSNGDMTSNYEDASSWWAWHDEKVLVDTAVMEAINEPGGGDYAKAVDLIRRSNRPPAVKQLHIGQLIIGGLLERSPRRPPETMEQGVRMVESAAMSDEPSETPRAAAQQLRLLFENGDGKPPITFPKDPEVAACWLALEKKNSTDPNTCVALRRQRMPNMDRMISQRL